MQLSFGNMNMELTNFKIIKQPHDVDEGIFDVDLIKELVDYALVWILILTDQLMRSMPYLIHHIHGYQLMKGTNRATGTIKEETQPITTKARAHTIIRHFKVS